MSPNSDPRYHGYVARWYTYFNHDSYFSKLAVDNIHVANTLLSLWVTFTFLNLFIPIFFITRGKQIFQRLTRIFEASNQRVYRAVVLTIILFNVMYTLLMVILHFQGHPNVLSCLHLKLDTCNIPQTATSFDYVAGILITKAVTLSIALLIELLAAMYIAKGSFKITCSRALQFTYIMQVFMIWQLFVFVQITVGLISIPWLMLMLISPVYTLLVSGGIVLVGILISFILINIPIPRFQRTQCKEFLLSMTGFMAAVEMLIMVGLVCSAFLTYYEIVNDGMNMDGVKGYIISLVPTVPISIFVWVIKKKFLEERISNKKELTVNKEAMNERLSKTNRSLPNEAEMTALLSESESMQPGMNTP